MEIPNWSFNCTAQICLWKKCEPAFWEGLSCPCLKLEHISHKQTLLKSSKTVGKIKSLVGPLNLTRNCQLVSWEQSESRGWIQWVRNLLSNNLHLQAFPIKRRWHFLQAGLESGGDDSDLHCLRHFTSGPWIWNVRARGVAVSQAPC